MCKNLFKPNDWQEVFISKATYDTWKLYFGQRIESTKREQVAVATLFYSKSRNKYHIIESGYIPTNGYQCSDAYIACVNKQIELTK